MAGKADKTVPVRAPDGTPGTLPESELDELAQSGGSIMSAEEVAQEQKQIAARDKPFDVVDYVAAGAHGRLRGQGEALGVPVDSAITGVASLLGPDAERKTQDYLKKLEEDYPLTHGFNRMAGLVGGAVAGGELTGAARLGRLGRVAYGGVENVAQENTNDFNEAALGRAEVNSEKLLASMPKHFLVGAALVGGVEGIAAAGSKGLAALRSGAVPRLERGATGAIGRELGFEGEEALLAGERIRGLNEGEVPSSASSMAGLLSEERSAIQAREAGRLSMEQEGARKAVIGQGARRVSEAEASRAVSLVEAGGMATEGVEAAEAGLLRARGSAKALADEGVAAARLRASEGLSRAEAAAEEARARIPKPVTGREVEAQYKPALEAIRTERSAASNMAELIARERAENAKELRLVLRQTENLHSGGWSPKANAIAADEAARAKGQAWFDRDVGPALKKAGSSTTSPEQGALFAKLTELNAIMDSRLARQTPPTEAAAARVLRLQQVEADLARSQAGAIEHLAKVEAAEESLAAQVANDVRAAEAASAAPQAPSKEVAAAEKAIEKAARDGAAGVTAAEREAAQILAKVEGQGETSIAKARKEGERLVAAAKKEADRAVEAARRLRDKDLAAFEKKAAKEQAAVSSMRTDVDPLLERARLRASQGPGPAVSDGAKAGALASLLHGNPVGAAGALASSFLAGRVRAEGNLFAAKAMRFLSKQITSMDEAIRKGAASAVRGTASKAALTVDGGGSKRGPTFEKVSQSVLEAKGNPALVERRVQHVMGSWVKQAPMTYAATLVAAQRAQAFLESVLPQAQKDSRSLTPHLEEGQVSDSERYDFMEAVKAVADPIEVFRDVQRGSVTDQQIEAVRTVYPNLYAQMQQEVMNQLAMLQKPVAYERAVHLGTLLGVPTDEVLDDAFQRTQAQMFEARTQAQQTSKPGSQPRGPNSRLSKSMQSTSERVERGEQ